MEDDSEWRSDRILWKTHQTRCGGERDRPCTLPWRLCRRESGAAIWCRALIDAARAEAVASYICREHCPRACALAGCGLAIGREATELGGHTAGQEDDPKRMHVGPRVGTACARAVTSEQEHGHPSLGKALIGRRCTPAGAVLGGWFDPHIARSRGTRPAALALRSLLADVSQNVRPGDPPRSWR